MLEDLRRLGGNPFFRNQMTLAFTGPRLGFGFLLVGAVLSITHLILYAEHASMRAGAPTFLFAHNLAMLVLLVVLLPIKAAGSLEGPRLSGVFDQLVGTGVSPTTMALGAWASALLYAVMILVASLPFAVAMHWLVEVPPASILASYAALLVYANVILAISLAATSMFREFAAVPGTILGLGACILFAVIPDRDTFAGAPDFFTEMTPARWFFAQSFSPDDLGRIRIDFTADPTILLWSLPLALFRCGIWTALVGIAVLLIVIGPAHRFAPGLNSFGSVASGKRLAGLMRRLRGGLTRKIEVAFFYQNAPAWTRRWGFAIRAGLVLLLVPLIWVLFVGSVYQGHPYPVHREMFRDELLLSCLIVPAMAVVLWILWSCDGKQHRHVPVQIGKRRLPRELYVTLATGLLCAGWFGLEYLLRQQILANAAVPLPPTPHPSGMRVNLFDWDRFRLSGPMTPTELQIYAASSWHMILVVLCLLVDIFLISRLAARLLRFARLATIFATIALWIGPPLLGKLALDGYLSESFLPIARLSPLYFSPTLFADFGSQAERIGMYLQAHGVLMLVLLLPLVLGSLLRRKTLTAAIVLLGAATLSAQGSGNQQTQVQPPPFLESATRGFEGCVFDWHTDFFTLVVRNDTDAPIEASYWFDSRSLSIHRRVLYLSPHSRKTLRFAQRNLSNYWNNNTGRVVFQVGSRRYQTKDLYSTRIPSNRNSTGTQQHLFVDQKIDVPAPFLSSMLRNNAENAVSCAAQNLPIDAISYSGLECVWLRASSLQAMTPQQRTALYRYAILGGVVLFHGGVPDRDTFKTGIWEQLLDNTTTREYRLDGKQLVHVALTEGGDLLHSGDGLPILNLRSLGTGYLGHSSFMPHAATTPAALLDDPKFWLRLADSLPRGLYPSRIYSSEHTPLWGDWSTLGLLSAYLGGYSLLLVLALFFAGWRKKQPGSRLPRWRWIALPLLFSLGIPFLVAGIRSVPSGAKYIEYTWFGAGSTRGVVHGHLSLRSAGKQDHRISIDDPSVFAESRAGFSLGSQLADAAGGDTDHSTLRVATPAWGRAGIDLTAPRQLATPVEGSARRSGPTSLTIAGRIPEQFRGVKAWCCWYQPKVGTTSQRLVVDAAGRFRTKLVQAPPKRPVRSRRNTTFTLAGHQLRVLVDDRERVHIVLAIDTLEHPGGLELSSADLDFTTSIPQHRSPIGYFTMLPRVGKDQGRSALLVRRTVVLELPLK